MDISLFTIFTALKSEIRYPFSEMGIRIRSIQLDNDITKSGPILPKHYGRLHQDGLRYI
jgi:hypothetical protein